MDASKVNKNVIVFLSGSAGELDWMLPILDTLLKKGFLLKIVFLSKHCKQSVENNQMLFEFIHKDEEKIRVFFIGGYFIEKIEHLGYLTYRAYLRFELGKKSLLGFIYRVYEKVHELIFFNSLPNEILELKDNKNILFSEYPSLRRPRDKWLKRKFEKSIYFYCPHSPHIYAEELDRKYDENELNDFNKFNFLLLGHPADYFFINDGEELAKDSLEKLYIGHPKYSQEWLKELQNKSINFRSTLSHRASVNILVLSRGYGSYLDRESHKNLVQTTIENIHSSFSNYNLIVKKHPREVNSHWDNLTNDFPSIYIKDEHIMRLATEADFVISFWSSGAMDCFLLNVPVIEYFDPIKHPKQQVSEGNSYTTIYRKLKIVSSASNSNELKDKISDLVKSDYKISSNDQHPYYKALINRSDSWKEKFEKVLSSHGYI